MDSFLEGISSSVKIKTIKEATEEAIELLKDKQSTHYIKTGINKLDDFLGGGVEGNQLITIGGISGSGKSALANMIETYIAENYNDVVVLNFSFEMTAKSQVLRKASSKCLLTTKQIREIKFDTEYKMNNTDTKEASSSQDVDLPKSHFIKSALSSIATERVYYVEESLNVKQLCETIESFQRKCFEEKRRLVIFLDHALLIDGKSIDERTNVADLQKALIRLKKTGSTTIFQLMQLNRNIEATERRTNRLMHYPMRSDLSTADAVYQGSDHVWIIHRPELLNIKSYGPQEIDAKGRVFLHIIKFREGEPKILMFNNLLKYNRMENPKDAER